MAGSDITDAVHVEDITDAVIIEDVTDVVVVDPVTDAVVVWDVTDTVGNWPGETLNQWKRQGWPWQPGGRQQIFCFYQSRQAQGGEAGE